MSEENAPGKSWQAGGREEGEPSGPRRGLVPEATAAPRPLGMRESQSLPGKADHLVRQTNSRILT